ncbi:hypothetical protein Q7P37_008301 [Cladosporium fusiforme]
MASKDIEAHSTPISLQSQSQSQFQSKPMPTIGNPTPLAMGGFATTLLTLSLSMMGFRGVHTQTVFVGDLCFAAGIGMLISAQWEIVRGNTFTYTVLSAFGLFYGGYGATLIPAFGIIERYGGLNAEYYNAVGFFVLIWAVLDVIFIIASLRMNVVLIGVFTTIFLCFSLDAASYFALADGHTAASTALLKTAGAFGFISGLLGFYTVAHYLFDENLGVVLPMGDTSRFFKGRLMAREKVV